LIDHVSSHVESEVSLAFDLGFKVSDLVGLNTLTYAERHEYMINPDYIELAPCKLLMKRPPGVSASFVGWYDGGLRDLVVASVDRFMLSGSQGEEIEGGMVTVFTGSAPAMRKYFGLLAEMIEDQDPDYRGIISLEVNVDGNDVWYKHIGFGTSETMIHAMARLAGMDTERFIGMLEHGKEIEFSSGYAVALPVYAYPYSIDDNADLSPLLLEYDVRHDHGDGHIVITGQGQSIASSWKGLYKELAGLPSDVCYRIDGDVPARKMFHVLKKSRFLE